MKQLICVLSLLMGASGAHAQVDTEAFHQALKVKKELYYKNATISGGDRTSIDYRVSNIRIAQNPAGYDRIVIDLTGNAAGEKSTLSRPPYFQVEVDSVLKKTNVTLYGKPKLEFTNSTIHAAAKKAKSLNGVDLLPMVDADRWTFSLDTQPGVKAEVFELTDPARIIIDLKR